MLTLLVYNFRKEYISAMYFYSAIVFINQDTIAIVEYLQVYLFC